MTVVDEVPAGGMGWPMILKGERWRLQVVTQRSLVTLWAIEAGHSP